MTSSLTALASTETPALVQKYYVVTRKMEPKKRNKDRQWKRKVKVSPNISKDFPWEVVLRFLDGHARSLILLQMVDKNLNHLITTDDKLWVGIFKREIKSHAYCVRSISDSMYPNLRLWKPHLTGLPVYVGPLRGDSDDCKLGSDFDASFSSYVRRVFALKHGTRCGMCGCRYRHEPYWSLRMRVCRLCINDNTVTGEVLSRKYGVDYSDMLVKHKGKFFFFNITTSNSDDRVSLHGMTKSDVVSRFSVHMFWLPHLRKFLDFPALYQQQVERRQAAVVLSNAIKRRWNVASRKVFGTVKAHHSIDCLLVALQRNEKKRLINPYGSSGSSGSSSSSGISGNPSGPAWCFPEHPHGGKCKLSARTGVDPTQYYRMMVDFDDSVVN